jgi:PAS domain S-box-containing protein
MVNAPKQEIKVSLQDLEEIYRNSFLPTLILRNFKVLFANDQFLKLIKYSKEDGFKDFDVRKLWLPNLKEELEQRATRRLAGEEVIKEYFTTIIDTTGIEIDVLVKSNLIQLTDGPAIITYLQDFSHQNQFIEQQETLKKLYQDTIENAPEPTVLLNIKSRNFMYVNKSYMKLVGYQTEDFYYDVDFLETSNFNFIGEDQNNKENKIRELYLEILENKYATTEIEYYSKVKGTLYLLARCSLIQLDGNLIIRITFEDLTEKMDYSRKLEESEDLFKKIIDDAPEAIALLDVESNKIIHFNKAYLEMLELQEHEILGTTIASEQINPETQLDGEKSVDKMNKIIKETLKNKKGLYLWINKLPSGKEIISELHTIALEVSHVKLIRCMQIDITDTYLLRKNLNKAQKDLAELLKNEVMGHFAASISHDFNNILTSIIGYTEFILENIDDESIKNYLQEILDIAIKTTELNKDLQIFSRKSELKISYTNLSKEIINMLKLIKVTGPESVTLDFELSKDLPEIKIDVGKLQHTIITLIENANQATSDFGTISISTQLITRDELEKDYPDETFSCSEYIVLGIRDDGRGLSDEEVETIFEPYILPNSGKFTTKLGLASIHSYMKQIQGHIFCKSKLNKGTTFYLCFPICSK